MVPYKECKSGQEPQQFTETKLTAKKFVEQGCTQVQDFFVTSFLDISLQIAHKVRLYIFLSTQGKKTIPHTKLLPECRNVTKQNCVTLWETDANGKQVKTNYFVGDGQHHQLSRSLSLRNPFDIACTTPIKA